MWQSRLRFTAFRLLFCARAILVFFSFQAYARDQHAPGVIATSQPSATAAAKAPMRFDEMSRGTNSAQEPTRLNALHSVLDGESDTLSLRLPHATKDICSRKGGICYNDENSQADDGSLNIVYKNPTCNLNAGVIRPSFCISHMLHLLSFVTARLEQEGIMHWLHQGTLLGAVRDGQILPWANDVDIAFFERDLDAVVETLKGIEELGMVFHVHLTEPFKIPWIVVSGKVVGTHLDLAGFRIYRPGVEDPYNAEQLSPIDTDSTFVGHCLKSIYECKDRKNDFGFTRAKDILPLKFFTFMGRDFLIPNNETAYLMKNYGSTWNVVDREGKGNWHSEEDDLHVSKNSEETGKAINLDVLRFGTPRIYVDVVGDLVHYGHVNLFIQAKKWGQSLIVGVHNDSTVASYKRRPIMSMEERIKVIEQFSVVDFVIPNAPIRVTKEYIQYNQIDLVIHGDDTPFERLQEMYSDAMDLGIFKTVPYTKGVSTSDIIGRVLERSGKDDDYNRLSKKRV